MFSFYNGSRYIKEQLFSILASNLEGISLHFIVINDASTQKETNYLINILPANHTYIENEVNLGVIRSVEKGLMTSSADYVMLCDQDDFWLPGKIKESLSQIQLAERENPTLLFTDLVIVGPKLEELHSSMFTYYRYDPTKVYPSILFQNIITGCTVMMNRKLVEISLPFPPHITMHDHWLASCAVFMGKVVFLPRQTILYRQHGKNQVGAPLGSKLKRFLRLRSTIKALQKHTYLKTEMVKALAARLREHNYNAPPDIVQKIAEAYEKKDFIFLLKNQVITGPASRVISAFFLFTLLKIKKWLH